MECPILVKVPNNCHDILSVGFSKWDVQYLSRYSFILDGSFILDVENGMSSNCSGNFKNGMSQIKVIAVNRFGTLGNPIVISETDDSRSSGFPQMELFKNEL